MEHTVEEGPLQIRLSDGRLLFTRYHQQQSSDIRQTPLGPVDFGQIIIGPKEEWIRNPDGSEHRGSHYAAMMSTIPKPKPTLWDRIKQEASRVILRLV